MLFLLSAVAMIMMVGLYVAGSIAADVVSRNCFQPSFAAYWWSRVVVAIAFLAILRLIWDAFAETIDDMFLWMDTFVRIPHKSKGERRVDGS